jgi:8-oxo-dGTP pyrophosphatase MutT (NUDIX family)
LPVSDPVPSTPRPAATTILLRAAEGTCEVLLQQRGQLGFMAGAFVFPGGRLDAEDQAPRLFARCDLSPEEAARRLGERPGTSEALGLHVAALRELFEEAGVLLARGPEGRIAASEGPFPQLRRELHARRTGLLEIAEAHSLLLLTSELRYAARWVTPELEPKRFDARFFVACAPESALPSHDQLEAVESRWIAPREALRLGRERRIALPPPTMKTLELLAALGSPAEALSWAEAQNVVTVGPEAQLMDGRVLIVLPGDPLSTAPEPVFPGPTRYVLDGGFWAPG